MNSSEQPVLVVAEVKYKKQEGALVLTPSRVGWSPEGESQLVVDVLYGKIKGLPTCIHIATPGMHFARFR